jgi:spermidine synthase
MRFFPKHYTLQSEKNGTVSVTESFFGITVYAGGFEQSGPYLLGLWGRAVREIKSPESIRSVLLIGLGGGSNVSIAEKRFRNARITAIEWDKVMIDLAVRLHQFKKEPHIIHGDIRNMLPALTEKYDVILSDAFYGDKPDVGIDGNVVGESLPLLLSPKGACILNASRTPESIEYISRFLKLKKKWRYRDNTVAMFVHNS